MLNSEISYLFQLQAIGEAKDSVFYDVFRQSLNEFCKNLVNDTSLALQVRNIFCLGL